MSSNLPVSVPPKSEISIGLDGFCVPAVVAASGQQAEKRFLEFFTAKIRNPNTRKAYVKNARDFLEWCEALGISEFNQVEPVVVAAYIEKLTREHSAPTVKQRLSTIRKLFDFLVVGQVIPFNPASAVNGPKHVVKKGKTPVLFEDDARALIDSIDTSTLIGLRDRAMIAVMTYSFARVGAVVQMRVKHYEVINRKAWFVLHEKGGKFNRVPAHHKAAEYVEAYINAAGIAEDKDGYLFRSFAGRGRTITERPLDRKDSLRMVKRRALAAGFPASLCNHTFRGTGITNYLQHGGTIEKAAYIAGHESTRTTGLYNRGSDEVELGEIERIRI